MSAEVTRQTEYKHRMQQKASEMEQQNVPRDDDDLCHPLLRLKELKAKRKKEQGTEPARPKKKHERVVRS